MPSFRRSPLTAIHAPRRTTSVPQVPAGTDTAWPAMVIVPVPGSIDSTRPVTWRRTEIVWATGMAVGPLAWITTTWPARNVAGAAGLPSKSTVAVLSYATSRPSTQIEANPVMTPTIPVPPIPRSVS